MTDFKAIHDRLENNFKYYAGYPINTCFDYSNLFDFLKWPMNNLGDPFLLKNSLSSQDYEIEVIKWFLQRYGLDDSQGWGYVTSCGSEGVLFGSWQGREHLNNPILYYSAYAHYCVPKVANILGVEARMIATDERGVLDYDDFARQLDNNRDALIVATLGNTITSAIDDVAILKNIVKEAGVNHYVHADAAFDGMILPFIEHPYHYQLVDGIDSVSISGHKLIGSPVPCGVVLIHKDYLKKSRRDIAYVANIDCTINGSRSGFTPLVLWQAIKNHGSSGFAKLIASYLASAKDYCSLFQAHNINAWRFETAVSIVVDKLPNEVLQKWLVPSNDRYSSFMALPRLTPAMVEEIIADITTGCCPKSEGSAGFKFPVQSPNLSLLD